MDFQALYQSKLTTAAEAAKLVKSGDWVDYTWCTNHPVELDKALAARQNELEDVKVRGGVTMWMPEIAKADDAGVGSWGFLLFSNEWMTSCHPLSFIITFLIRLLQ